MKLFTRPYATPTGTKS